MAAGLLFPLLLALCLPAASIAQPPESAPPQPSADAPLLEPSQSAADEDNPAGSGQFQPAQSEPLQPAETGQAQPAQPGSTAPAQLPPAGSNSMETEDRPTQPPKSAAPPTPLQWTRPDAEASGVGGSRASPLPAAGAGSATPGTSQPAKTAPSSRPPSVSAAPASPGAVKQLLARALAAAPGEGLDGQPTSLLSLLGKTAARSQQLAIVKTYWQLAVEMADYHHAVDELQFLSGLSWPAQPHEASRLRAALAVARARRQEVLLAVVAAQRDVAELAAWPAGQSLPLASDRPLVGRYLTRFDALFANRPAPAGLRRINATLPFFLDLIEARGSSVQAADQWRQTAASAYQTGQAGVADVLAAHRQLRDERIALLAAVRDYNHAIADYALAVAQAGLPPRDIVRMLVEPTGSQPAPTTAGGTPPADGQPQPRDRVATRPEPSGTSTNTAGPLVPVQPAPKFLPAQPLGTAAPSPLRSGGSFPLP